MSTKKIQFKNGKVEDYTIILSNKALQLCGQIPSVQNVRFSGNLNSPNEVSFTVYRDQQILNTSLSQKEIEKYQRYVWDNIIDLKVIYIKEVDMYFEIRVSTEDKNDTVKNVTGTYLPNAELSQINLYTIEINSEADIARDDYKITTFYNSEDPKASLLDRILDKAPHYKIKHVDKSLCKLQRTFSIDGTSIHDFLTGECSEQFDCLFQFDSTDRSISAYDLMTVCEDCGERGEFEDSCLKCGSKNLKYFGEDTTIYVDKNNLTDAITVEMDADSIKNCFKLEAGDEIMTAAVRNLNPNGSDYIYAIRDEDKAEMPTELVEKLASYDELYDSYINEYRTLTQQAYDLIDDIQYYTSSMMPTIEQATVTAATEAAKLTAEALSPISLEKEITKSTSLATVNSALKNYAKVIVKVGYVKLEIEDDATFTYVGIDENEWTYGTWYGRFKVTNYSDKDDVAYSDYITVTVNNNYPEFMKQKIEKSIKSDDDENYVFDVLAIDDLEKFKYAITLYSLNRLGSFCSAIRGATDILAKAGHAEEGSDLYEPLYLPYYYKLQACQEEMDKRQQKIDELQHDLDLCNERCTEIRSDLNLQDYLGDLYTVFCSYRREDKFTNSNYISDGLDNVQLLDNAQKFWEIAKKEIVKASTGVITITSTLYNFLTIKEFQPLVDHFELGNWIRIRADRQLYRLRLIGYEIDFDNLQTINVTFSTVTKVKNVHTDRDDIINSAQSMAKSYSTIVRQMEQTKDTSDNVNSILENGWNSALTEIKNNNNEEVTYSKRGLLLREYDDILDDYTDEQCLLTHNSMVYTTDNWKTAKCALGKHSYTYYNPETKKFETAEDYGITSKFVQAGYIYSSQFIGGDIYSVNYSPTKGSHLDLNNGTFSFAGGKLVGRIEDGQYMLDITGRINVESGYIGSDTSLHKWLIGDAEDRSYIYNGTDSMTSTIEGTYIGTDGFRNYKSDDTYVNIQDGQLECDNAVISNAQISGIYKHYNALGKRSIEIENNHIYIYGWWEGAKEDTTIGAIGTTYNTTTPTIGGLGIIAQNGNRVFLGYEDDDGNTSAAISINKEKIESGGTPFIVNTVGGNLFPNNPGGGVEFENGLIKSAKLQRVLDSTLSVITGLSWNSNGITSVTRANVVIKDGLIHSWESSTKEY